MVNYFISKSQLKTTILHILSEGNKGEKERRNENV